MGVAQSAFVVVRSAKRGLPFGSGFAAGAVVSLALTGFVPEALEVGEGLDTKGYPGLVAGFAAGFAVMVPLLLFV